VSALIITALIISGDTKCIDQDVLESFQCNS